MKFWGYLFLAAIVLWSFSSQAALVTMESPYSVKRTMDRLQKAVKSKKLKVFSRINHAVGAKKAGLKLADSEVLIFGNPKVGTQFMQAHDCFGSADEDGGLQRQKRDSLDRIPRYACRGSGS